MKQRTTPTFETVIPRLPVADLQRTVEFYCGRLGFERDVVWPEETPTFAILCRDSIRLGFFERSEHQPGPIGYAELYIQVADSLQVYELIHAHLPIEWGPDVYSYGRREFAFRDPDGYLVILTEPTEETPPPA